MNYLSTFYKTKLYIEINNSCVISRTNQAFYILCLLLPAEITARLATLTTQHPDMWILQHSVRCLATAQGRAVRQRLVSG